MVSIAAHGLGDWEKQLDSEGPWDPALYDMAMLGIDEFDLMLSQLIKSAVAAGIGVVLSGEKGHQGLIDDFEQAIDALRARRPTLWGLPARAVTKVSNAAGKLTEGLRKLGVPIPRGKGRREA